MSTLPLILALSNRLDELTLSPYYRHSFDWEMQPHESFRAPLNLATLLNELQRRRSRPEDSEVISSVGRDGFQVCIDVQQFKPKELSVKVVQNSVVVEGKHEEREDEHGYISRHFVRRYSLPNDYDAEKLISTLSSDGILTVRIPKPCDIEDKSKERIVQIQQTGPAYLNVKQNEVEELEEADPQDGGASGDK